VARTLLARTANCKGVF